MSRPFEAPTRPLFSVGIRDERLGAQDHARDTGGVLERAARHLGGVDDACVHQIDVRLRHDVEAPVGLLFAAQCSTTTLPSSPALATSWRSGSCSARFRISAPTCSSPSSLKRIDSRRSSQQRRTPARHDALFDRRAGGMQRVFDARLFLLQLDSVAAPTFMTATPPLSLARRSCSFSLS